MHAFERRASVFFFRFLCCLILLTTSRAQVVPQMPKIEGESFAGNKVVLPDAAAGKVAVLIFGFTKASKVATSTWAKRVSSDFGARPDIQLYQLPVLEDVPRLVRGMVFSGIKKGVSENQRDHFVPILQSEAELKKFFHYNEPDDAYLAALGRTGNIIERIHGTPSETNYPQLRLEIETALNQK